MKSIMKNKAISLFTCFAIFVSVIVPCLLPVTANESSKILTHRTVNLQNFDSLTELDGYITDSTTFASKLVSANGGKVLSLTAEKKQQAYDAEIALAGAGNGFPVCASSSEYFAFSLKTPGDKGNTVAVCLKLSVWNEVGGIVNFPEGTKIEYAKDFSDENAEIGSATFGAGGWNVNLPAGEEYRYRINMKEAFGENAVKLNSVWGLYFTVNAENNWAGDFILDDFELQTVAGAAPDESYEDGEIDAVTVAENAKDGSFPQFNIEIKNGVGSNGSRALMLTGKGDAAAYIKLDRGRQVDLLNHSDRLYWYMDIRGIAADTVELGFGLDIEGTQVFNPGSLTYADTLDELENGISKAVEMPSWGSWGCHMPTGKHWFCLDLNNAFDIHNTAALGKVYQLWMQYNPWNNGADMSGVEAEFVIDSIHTNKSKVGDNEHQNGGFMNESYDDDFITVENVYENTDFGFAASLLKNGGVNGTNALQLVGETKDNGASAPMGWLLTNRGFTSSLTKDGHNYIYFHLTVSGTDKGTVPIGILPMLNGNTANGLFGGSLEYAKTIEQLENGNAEKSTFKNDGWSVEVPVGSYWYRICLETSWNDLQRLWAEECTKIGFSLNPVWEGDSFVPSGRLTFIIDNLHTKYASIPSDIPENGSMNENYDSDGLTVDNVYQNGANGFTASIMKNVGVNNSAALKLVGGTRDNGNFSPMGWLLTNRGAAADLTKDGHNYIYFHLDITGTKDKTVPMGIVPELNGSTVNGLFGGALEYADTLEILENGRGNKTNFQNGGWSVDVPTGSHWFRICLEKSYSAEQLAWAKACTKICFNMNPYWKGNDFVPSGELTFIIDSLYTKKAEISGSVHKDGEAMNETYDEEGISVDDVYQNGANAFSASLIPNGGVNGSPALKLVGGTKNNGEFSPMGWLLTNRGMKANLVKDGHNYIYFHMSVSGTKNKTVPVGIIPELNGSTVNGLFGGSLEYAETLSDLENGKGRKNSFQNGGWSVDVPVGSYWYRICLKKSYNDEQLRMAESCIRICFNMNPSWEGNYFVPSGDLTFIIDSLHTKYAEIFGSVHKDGEAMNETYDEKGISVDDVYQNGDTGFEASLVEKAGVNGTTALKLVGETKDNGKTAPMGWLLTNRGAMADITKDGHNYIYFHLSVSGTSSKTVPVGIVPELNGSTVNGLFGGTLEYADTLKALEDGKGKKSGFKSDGWSVDVPVGSYWYRICLDKSYSNEQKNMIKSCKRICFNLNPYWNGNDFVPSGKITFVIDSLHTQKQNVYGSLHKDGQIVNEDYDEFGLQASEVAETVNDKVTAEVVSKKGVNGTSALQMSIKRGGSAALLLNRGYTANLLANNSNYLYFHINSSGAEQKLLQLGLVLELKGIGRTETTFGNYLEYADTLEDFRDTSSIHRARFLSGGWNIKLPANKSYWVRINLGTNLSKEALRFADKARSLIFNLNMEYPSEEKVTVLIDSFFTANEKQPDFDSKADGAAISCDDDYRWQITYDRGEILLDTVNKLSGKGAVNLYGSDPTGELWMRYIYNRNINLSGLKMRNSYDYSIWVNTQYADKIKEITFSFADEQGVNDDGTQNWKNFITWTFKGEELKNGEWTKLTFNSYSPSKSYSLSMQYTRIKGVYVRIIAKNPGDYVEATFDQFEYLDNRRIVESNINAPLNLSMPSLKPQSLDKNVISFLNYKTVVAKGITVKQLKDSVKLDDKYALAVVDKNGKEIADDETVKTGMWLVVKYKKTALSMYYIEIGDPTDTNGTEDVPMSGRPFLNALSVETDNSNISGKTNKTATVIIILAAACLATAGSVGFIVWKKKKLKNVSNK